VTSAAIYARVPGARQKKDETIGSQTAALRDHAGQLGVELPEEWVFEDEGHSGATLVRPALERLRDVVAGVGVDVVLCYSPDRLARKFAYQALLIEEFARAGTRVEFIKGPRGDSPEDQLMVQFQGMFAEYEKAQLMERYRRGKAYRARAGSVNVLGGAPFGYRYLSKSPGSGAGYEIAEHEAVLVAEMFRRYADDGASIADLARWLTSENVPTRTGKPRWDRSVIWGMLRNPAYAGTAVFGKTMVVQESPGLNRRARLEGRTTPRASKTVDRPRKDWIEIAVPAIVTAGTFERAARRLEDNKRFASRNTKIPSLLQGLAACSACGYGYYRTSTRTTSKKIYYYRCLGSDDYRYQGGRVCGNQPVRADYLDTVVWDHITHLLADPALIRAEISKRLEQARTADPATRQRKRLELALAKATTAITRMIEAFQEQLITIDELRSRMPDLRARETNLRGQLDALDAQLADQEAYLKLADDLEGFLTQLRASTSGASVPERQRVLRLLVKDVLVGPEKITIRHRIPIRERTSHSNQERQAPDTEGDQSASCPLRWGRAFSAAEQCGPVGPGRVHRPGAGRSGASPYERARRRRQGLPNYRLCRYADDWCLAISGTKAHAEALKEEIAKVLSAMGLRLSPEKTLITHIDEGLDFLGWRIQRHRKRGTGKSYVYVYPAKKALVAIMAKVKAFCRQSTNLPLSVLLIHLSRMPRGWTAYFKYGCSNATFSYLRSYLWKQVIRWQERKHRRTPWKELRRRYGRWPTDGAVELFDPAKVSAKRYYYRGTKIAAPWPGTA
jgi:site-specific DNA recombinase